MTVVTFGRTVVTFDGEGALKIRRSRTEIRVDGVRFGDISGSSEYERNPREIRSFSATGDDGSQPGGVYTSLSRAKEGVRNHWRERP